MNEPTPNDDQFSDLAKRYMASVHDLHLPTPEHRWHFSPSSARCAEGTCDWDVVACVSVGPDGEQDWEANIPDGFNEWMSLPGLLQALIDFDGGKADHD